MLTNFKKGDIVLGINDGGNGLLPDMGKEVICEVVHVRTNLKEPYPSYYKNTSGLLRDDSEWDMIVSFTYENKLEHRYVNSQTGRFRYKYLDLNNISPGQWLREDYNNTIIRYLSHKDQGSYNQIFFDKRYLLLSGQCIDGKDYIANRDIEKTLRLITDPTMNNNKKIIGYIVPHDLYGGSIRAGWVVERTGDENSYRYFPKYEGKVSDLIPKEIVEKWEPAYEEMMEIADKKVEFFDEYIKINSCVYTKSDLKTLVRLIKDTDIHSLNVGCNGQHKVGKDIIEQILNKL